MIFSEYISLNGYRVPYFLLYFIFLFQVSCSGNNNPPSHNHEIAEAPTLSYAKRLKLESSDGYSQVLVYDPWQGAINVQQKWFLVPGGKKLPPGTDSSNVIRVPVRRIICMSTTHIAMISALQETESVAGFSGTAFIYNEDLRKKVKEGIIHEIGYEDNINKELILKLNPDLVMIYGVGTETAGYVGKLKELGIKVLFNADHLESEPLGKAEWIKLFGALYCKEQMADSIFRSIENKYTEICNLISKSIKKKPEVLLGLPFRDTWYISPGNSYISKLISDAGGDYLWKDKVSTTTEPASLENVYLKALKAEYWMNIGNVRKKADILAIDPRLADLRSFKTGNLFNNNKRISEGGGNDYWESGSINPDLILKDLGTIMHPELFPGGELFYYNKIN